MIQCHPLWSFAHSAGQFFSVPSSSPTLSYPSSLLFTPAAQGFSCYYLNGPQDPSHRVVRDESNPAAIVPSAPSYHPPPVFWAHLPLVLIRKQTSAGLQTPSYFVYFSTQSWWFIPVPVDSLTSHIIFLLAKLANFPFSNAINLPSGKYYCTQDR